MSDEANLEETDAAPETDEPRPPSLDAPLRNDSPAKDQWVASLTDPAFDREHPFWLLLAQRYADTRAVADLVALPLLPNQRPTLWRVRALSISARAAVLGAATAASQQLYAVRFGLTDRADGAVLALDGTVSGPPPVKMERLKGTAIPQTTDKAIEAEVAAWGGRLVDELAAVIIDRMDLSPRRYLPFRLPLPWDLIL